MRTAGFAITLVLFATPAIAVECKATHDNGSYWSWRSIDGRKCWYRGHSVMPKSRLHWPARARKPKFRIEILPPEEERKRPDPPHRAEAAPTLAPRAPVEEPNDVDLDQPTPFEDIIEDRPFGPWEERIMGAFTK